MVWRDSLFDLDYYNPLPSGLPCYCETLVFPTDMLLQGIFAPGNFTYDLFLRVYSADGVTLYEDATSYFDYFFGVNPITGQHYFTARLKSYSPAMCSHQCFVVRATVVSGFVDVFDKWTERYCQFSCCDIVRSVTISQAGLVSGDSETTAVTTPTNPKQSPCGDVFITLRTTYDCYDKFTGEYYGEPNTIISGSYFPYEIISNFRGRVVRRPRDITREYSYNCRLQRVEAAPTYLLEGFEYFPSWKMYEIEGQLASTQIYVDDVRYEFNGGIVFEQLHDCFEVFKLIAPLNGCIVRQVFGCDTTCSPALNYNDSNKLFILPANYQAGSESPAVSPDFFYDETGVLRAYDYDGFLDYIRSLNGVTSVDDIDISGLDCEPYAVFTVTGSGYIPTSFYYRSVLQSNRVFGIVVSSLDEVCNFVPVTCAKPEFGTIVVADDTCDAPTFGTITVDDMSVTPVTITGFGDWSVDGAEEANVYNYLVTFTLNVGNPNYPEAGSPPQFIVFSGEKIGVIGPEARPTTNVALDENNSNMPAGTALVIEPTGVIRFSGEPMLIDGTGSFIFLTNISYNTNA